MPTWIAFLRAINLGARRKFPKDAIVAAVAAAGGTNIATHINTGNVRFDHELTDRAAVEAALEREFAADRGFEVPTICLTPRELREIAADAERYAAARLESGGTLGLRYVSLLKQEPDPEAVALLEGRSTAEEMCRVSGRGVHLLLGADHAPRLSSTAVEKALGVSTNRNVNVIRTLAERWGNG